MPEVTQPKNPGFKFGHPRVGGKKKNNVQRALALAERLHVDPMKFMLEIVKSDVYMQTVIKDGVKTQVETVIPIDTRIDAAKCVMQYMHPRLTATQITGADDGPIEVQTLNITQMLQDPAMVDLAQRLSLALSAQTPQTPMLLPAAVDVEDRLRELAEKDSK